SPVGPSTTPLNTGRRYNPATDTWSPVGTSTLHAPSARWGQAAVWTGRYMIIWGGDDGTSYLNTGGIYDPATDTWIGTTSTTNAPSARDAIAAVWDGSEMIVYGGNPGSYHGNGPDGYTFTGGCFNPISNTWTATTTTGATGKTRGSRAVWTGHEMIVFGGFDGFNFQQFGNRYKPTIDLAAGVYTDTITVADPAASNNAQTIAVTLTVTGSPDPVVITTHPATQTVYIGEQPVFFAGATGSPTLTYQWQRNSVNIPGATGFYYQAPAAVLGDEGATFRVIVTNPVGSATSPSATLHVNAVGTGPVITQHPAPQSVTAGQTASFLVTATGSPTLTYQWQKDSVDIPGATSALYVTPPTTLGDDGTAYRVIVTNGFGTATSLPALLTVSP
ncbi:MAG TPA: hypothetical protein VL860_09760, partial [Planctomycetota bacterium]|nr:hypothetical protein [Planctomycetota bacterium]